jgi:hypothetical protein
VDQLTPKKEIVTVAEMARMCGLSRSRFYGLVKDGIMPQPSRHPETQRPFYSREQQEQCLLVRKTNCGINGKPILFYAQRVTISNRIATPRRPRTARRSQPTVTTDPVILELQHGLEQLGLADVAEPKIRAALVEVYPDGHEGVPMPQLLMTVFRRLRERQDSQDNVAG